MSADDIEQAAAIWLAREDFGLTPSERDERDVWLAQSSRHKVAYLQLKAAWGRTERLAALKSPEPRAPMSRALSPRSGTVRRLALLAAATVVMFFGSSVYLSWRQQSEHSYATLVGHMRTVQLADGTRMELNTNTHVRTDVNARLRVVTLESGEAYFDVIHDASHPFIVYAGNWRITDLGTKFSVFLDGDDVRVLVREGRVRVDPRRGSAPSRSVVAQAGYAVLARGLETLVLSKPDADIASDLSWRGGVLEFDHQPLAEVAAQFNRYNAKQIQIEGSARKIPIGGSFKADKVDVFVQLLHRGFGLSVNDQGDRIVISR
jgi:transmembrane sensor